MSVQTEIDRIIGAVEAAHTAIAGKGGTTARPYLVGNLADAINTIPEAEEPELQAKTVSPTTSSQTVKPDSGYDGLSQVTVNAMPTATQATPSISVSSAGLITASATQSAGYVAAGTKSATKQLTTQAAKTVTPSTSSQTAVAKNVYTTGVVTVTAIPSKYQDVTTPLADLNTANGGTAATTMAGAVNNTESLANSHADLIAQIATALEGKAAGGGGGSVETCTVTITCANATIVSISYMSPEGAIYTTVDIPAFRDSRTYTMLKNSLLVVNANVLVDAVTIDGEITLIGTGERVPYRSYCFEINGDGHVTIDDDD